MNCKKCKHGLGMHVLYKGRRICVEFSAALRIWCMCDKEKYIVVKGVKHPKFQVVNH